MRAYSSSGVAIALTALICATVGLSIDTSQESHYKQHDVQKAQKTHVFKHKLPEQSIIKHNLELANGRKDAAESKKIVAYFSDWTTRDMPASSIPFNKLTHLNYAFAVIEDGSYKPVIQTDELLKDVVAKAHAKDVKVAISIGGWTASKFFSPMSATAHGRKSFVDATVDFAKQYNLDGIDIDWEYPGRLGMACNIFDKNNDAKNFLTLLQELREALPKDKYISLAVRIQPFDGPDGPLKNVSRFAEPVDFITVMAYDINVSWNATTGPNAPFKHSTAGGAPFSFIQSVNSWVNAGFPKEKILMGLPFYGRATQAPVAASSKAQTMFMPRLKPVPKGDRDDAPWAEPCPDAPQVLSGVWKWKNLREEGLLTSPKTAGHGWERNWDHETKTPWLLNRKDGHFISYDDPDSIKLKTDFVRCNNMGGVMVWALNQDNGELLDAVDEAMDGELC
ncbi:glycosyl hydrolases family 18-domain-containing protein [Syncephalis fuscata]|nr:glycosyl hydrolases family 18-domain-containing protein [Syncephalis fuscata]